MDGVPVLALDPRDVPDGLRRRGTRDGWFDLARRSPEEDIDACESRVRDGVEIVTALPRKKQSQSES